MTTEANKAIARRWSEELWNQANLAVADEIVAPDYVRHDGSEPSSVHGPEGVKQLVTRIRAMLPDLQIVVEDLIAEGDKIVSRYTTPATDTQGMIGRPATGKTIRTAGMQIFRIVNRKIVESWAVRDDLGALRELGIISVDAGAAARDG